MLTSVEKDVKIWDVLAERADIKKTIKNNLKKVKKVVDKQDERCYIK